MNKRRRPRRSNRDGDLDAQQTGLACRLLATCLETVLILAGIGVLVGIGIMAPRAAWAGSSTEVTLLLAMAFVATDIRPFTWLTQRADMTASWIFAYALILAGAPAMAIACHVLARGLSDISARKKILQAMHNMAAGVLAFGATWWLLAALELDQTLARGSSLNLSWFAAAVAGAVTMLLIYGVICGAGIAFDRGTPIRYGGPDPVVSTSSPAEPFSPSRRCLSWYWIVVSCLLRACS